MRRLKTMPHTKPTVSLVIPAYNEERQLHNCLQSIALQTVKPLEVIVVDNNSTDRTAAVAGSYPFVRVIKEHEQGRVYARNAGFYAAKGDVIGRIDADIILPDNWVEHVAKFYESPHHARVAWTGSGNFTNVRFTRLVNITYSLLAFRLNWLLVGHTTLWGSNMAILREHWQKVARSTCRRNDIHEDLDLAIHLHRAGYKICYDTTIKTNAELRRVHSNRHELWEYLQWWPHTLRVHAKKTWVICWFLGAFLLYWATYLLVIGKWTARRANPVAVSDAES